MTYPTDKRNVQPTTYVIHYRQTEYRKITVEAGSRDEARIKWTQGEGQDEFVATGDDATIITMDVTP